MSIVLNQQDFQSRLRSKKFLLQRNYTRRLQTIIDLVTVKIMAVTPVHTGETLRNWQWSIGSPTSTALPAAGSGPPGRTNRMPLGTEPRRGANESAPLQSAEQMKKDILRTWSKFWLINNAPNVNLLEAGELPTPETSRAPNGMLGITLIELQAHLRASKRKLLR